MLKWAVPNQRRTICNNVTSESATTSDSNHETCSNASSSDSSSSESIYDLSVPIRYHDRRASRPKSLAILSHDSSAIISDIEKLDSLNPRLAVNPRKSSSLYSSCSRANRHSMYIMPSSHDNPDRKQKSQTLESMSTYRHTPSKLSVYQPTANTNTEHDDGDDGVADVESNGILRISTTEKPKSSRNSFWKSLRLKAQGKNKEKLSKAHSISNLPVTQKLTSAKVYTDSPTVTQQPPPQILSVDTANTSTGLYDISPSYKSKSHVLRRRSFKLIKRENENKKPKRFSKALDYSEREVLSGSPDSGVSSMRLYSHDSDNPASPASPITPIDLEPTDLPCLKKQFTDAVLQYLNERLEKKGYSSTISVCSSSQSSRSDDGASDVFCYDTDTVLRRPHNNNNNNTTPTIKATF